MAPYIRRIRHIRHTRLCKTDRGEVAHDHRCIRRAGKLRRRSRSSCRRRSGRSPSRFMLTQRLVGAQRGGLDAVHFHHARLAARAAGAGRAQQRPHLDDRLSAEQGAARFVADTQGASRTFAAELEAGFRPSCRSATSMELSTERPIPEVNSGHVPRCTSSAQLVPGPFRPCRANAGGNEGPDVLCGDAPELSDAGCWKLAAFDQRSDSLIADRQQRCNLCGGKNHRPIVGLMRAERRRHGPLALQRPALAMPRCLGQLGELGEIWHAGNSD